MAYIGKQPVVGNFQVCDAISVVNGQAAYTLQVNSTNVEPETAFHMLVSLNGVLQKPGSSFTISGATLTFASNLATGDVIDFVILLGDVLNIGAPSDNTVSTASIQDNAVTAAKLASGAVSNAPAFEATISASQTLTENQYVKLAFNTEIFDTAGNYDHATNYRFTPQTAGKYFFYVNAIFNAGGSGEFERVRLGLYKNGSLVYYQQEGSQSQAVNSQRRAQTIQKVIELNGSSDYVEAFAFFEHDAQGAGTLELIESGLNNVFGAYKLIGV